MFDGIKIKDVSVSVDALLTNDRLTFTRLVDTQTGFTFDRTRRAIDKGLTFRLVPRKTEHDCRVEVKGSLHKFYNNGQHNADQFTINNLLLTLDLLVRDYGFDLFKSKINGVEFGVNIELPFSINQVLDNLICYKNQPFAKDTRSKIPYYVCQRQRYAVKLYDKGKQKGLTGNLLRFEIRVNKMQYFNDSGIILRTLADLSNVANYELLGVLLVETFNEILFDDLTVDPTNLTPGEQEVYRNGRNSRYWQTSTDLLSKQANRQRLSRDKQRYRAVLNQYGSNLQGIIAALISQTWHKLTTTDDDLMTHIANRRAVWKDLVSEGNKSATSGATCHKLTDYDLPVEEDVLANTCHKLTNITPPACHKLTDFPNGDLSQINPLYSGVHCDKGEPDQTQKPGGVVCPVTGFAIDHPRPRQRFVSAAQLRRLYTTDRRAFGELAVRFLTTKQAGATLDNQCYYMAHNIRNSFTNPFNNPLRRIKKYQGGKEGQMTLLFPISQMVRVTDRIQAGIDYRRGTNYEVNL